MKRISIILFSCMSLAACKQTDKKEPGNEPTASKQALDSTRVLEDLANFTTIHWFDSTYQDLGKVEEGQIVDVAFRFKNSGSKPLIVTSVSVGCGCTTISEKPNEPVLPGQDGVIRAKFDSKNMAGDRLKEIYVSANTEISRSHVLVFRVDVVKK